MSPEREVGIPERGLLLWCTSPLLSGNSVTARGWREGSPALRSQLCGSRHVWRAVRQTMPPAARHTYRSRFLWRRWWRHAVCKRGWMDGHPARICQDCLCEGRKPNLAAVARCLFLITHGRYWNYFARDKFEELPKSHFGITDDSRMSKVMELLTMGIDVITL